MKSFLLSGVHVGRIRVPAAGLLVLIGLFGAGLALGRFALPPEAPMTDARGPDAVDQRVETALGALAETTSSLQGRLEQIEQKLDAATDHARSSQTAADAALAEVRKLDGAVKTLAESQPEGAAVPDEAVTALQTQVAQLAEKIDRLTPSASGAQGLSEVAEKRIDDIADAVAALKTTLDAAVVRTPEGTGVDADALARTSREELQASLAELETKLRERFRALEDKIAVAPAAGAGAAPRAVVALERGVASGAAFAGELDAVARLMPQDPAIARLRPHAESGVATRETLARELKAVARALTQSGEPEAVEPAAQSSGVLSGFMAKVNNLVEIRKVETPDRATVAKAVADAQAGAAKGDLKGAAEALGPVSAGSGEVADWIARAGARFEVDAALGGLTRRALHGVAAAGKDSGS
ncbi:MAG: COG4223 family protein [Hyphomicrobiales bacterium]